MTSIKTTGFTKLLSEQLMSAFANSTVYLGVGRVQSWANDAAPDTAVNTQDEQLGVWNNMHIMKKVTGNDISMVVRRINWTSNTVYDMWRHDQDMTTKNFYVLTPEYNVYKCLKVGTKIYTINGYKNIENVSVGDELFDESSNVTIVTEKVTREIDEFIVIRARGNEITSSINHVHMIAKDRFSMCQEKLAQDVTVNDWLFIPFPQECGIDTINMPPKSDIRCKWWPEKIILDEKWARLIGLFLAEGCMGVYGRGHKLIWSFGEHEEWLADEVVDILQEKGIHSKKTLIVNKNGGTYKSSPYKIWSVVVNSIGLFTLFTTLMNNTKGAKNKEIIDLKGELVLPLIGGWLDGDGCRKQTSFSGHSESTKLISSLWKMLLKCKICGTITKNGKELILSRYEDIKKVNHFSKRLILDDDFDLRQKRVSKDVENYNNGWLVRIKSVEHFNEPITVIALETSSGKYIAEGFLTHNCLDNNRGAVSTVQPTYTSVASTNRTTDGYLWKFMYKLSRAQILRFLTDDWMPVKTLSRDDGSLQYDIQDYAVDGEILSIRVINIGNNFTSNITTNVSISGDGTGAYANAIANSVTNTIQYIAVTSRGYGYTWANVTVTSSNTAVANGATASAVISPFNGHGASPAIELGVKGVMVNVRLKGTENDLVKVDNDFRQVSLIHNPLKRSTSNVASNTVYNQIMTVTLSGSGGDYSDDEWVYQGASLEAATFKGRVVWFDSNQLELSNATGTIRSTTLTGATTSATRYVADYENQPLDICSGEVLYIDNRLPITRANTQTESIQIPIIF
jgi:intein/homing endonuclease